MTPARTLPDLALPAAVFTMMVIVPVGVMLTGRDLDNFDMLAPADAEGPAAWLNRIMTLAILGACLAATAWHAVMRAERTAVATVAMAGFLAFFVTHQVLNAVFGTVPSFVRSQVYPLIVIAAIYAAGAAQSERLVRAARNALLFMIVASLVFAVLRPSATLRHYAPEVRLPFVSFRFWGLGSSPNGIAPLGLLLILLVIHRPFASRAASWFAHMAGLTVVVLAQSQTTWLATLVIVPLLLLYRGRVGDGVPPPEPSVWARAFAASAGLGIVALLVALFGEQVANWDIDDFTDERSFTGRGAIWRLALDLFHDNPLFGYGPTAWEDEFRIRVGMPFAFTAHNQALQSLSTAGLFGLLGWLAYLATLAYAALRLARPTRGLSVALLVAFPVIRSFSEASFEFKTILGDDFILHFVLFAVLMSPTGEPARAPAASAYPLRRLRLS